VNDIVCTAYPFFFKCYEIERIARKPLVFAVILNQTAQFYSHIIRSTVNSNKSVQNGAGRMWLFGG
jgi:hypothetical protein